MWLVPKALGLAPWIICSGSWEGMDPGHREQREGQGGAQPKGKPPSSGLQGARAA